MLKNVSFSSFTRVLKRVSSFLQLQTSSFPEFCHKKCIFAIQDENFAISFLKQTFCPLRNCYFLQTINCYVHLRIFVPELLVKLFLFKYSYFVPILRQNRYYFPYQKLFRRKLKKADLATIFLCFALHSVLK